MNLYFRMYLHRLLRTTLGTAFLFGFVSSAFAQHGLAISKTHSGAFTQGDIGKTYSIVVSSVTGTGTLAGTVTVTDTLPAGLTATGFAGTGTTAAGAAW